MFLYVINFCRRLSFVLSKVCCCSEQAEKCQWWLCRVFFFSINSLDTHWNIYIPIRIWSERVCCVEFFRNFLCCQKRIWLYNFPNNIVKDRNGLPKCDLSLRLKSRASYFSNHLLYVCPKLYLKCPLPIDLFKRTNLTWYWNDESIVSVNLEEHVCRSKKLKMSLLGWTFRLTYIVAYKYIWNMP